MSAIGMNEFMSIPTGMFACDAMLKAADVELVSAGCVCAGKYYIVVTGDVAAVRSAVEAGKADSESYLVDSLVIPNVDSQVAPAICACTSVEQLNALGIWSATPYALPFTRRMPQRRRRMSRCWRSGLAGAWAASPLFC